MSFTHTPAVRRSVPLLIGLCGPSGSGKTYSALRLATGMAGGDPIFVIDTENGRSSHYAPKPGEKANPAKGTFEFEHVPFEPPFNPARYAEALEYCAKAGAKVIVVDSMSHEHEGPGGVLEMHEAEVERMAGKDWAKRERVKMAGWIRPKAERQKLLGLLTRLGTHVVLCFRAKEKIKPVPGKEPMHLGWMPIGAEEFGYETTAFLLLPPGSRGVPQLQPGESGERMMVKLPEQFQGMLRAGAALDEDLGRKLAQWAAGGSSTDKMSTKPIEPQRQADREPVEPPGDDPAYYSQDEQDAIRRVLNGKDKDLKQRLVAGMVTLSGGKTKLSEWPRCDELDDLLMEAGP